MLEGNEPFPVAVSFDPLAPPPRAIGTYPNTGPTLTRTIGGGAFWCKYVDDQQRDWRYFAQVSRTRAGHLGGCGDVWILFRFLCGPERGDPIVRHPAVRFGLRQVRDLSNSDDTRIVGARGGVRVRRGHRADQIARISLSCVDPSGASARFRCMSCAAASIAVPTRVSMVSRYDCHCDAVFALPGTLAA